MSNDSAAENNRGSASHVWDAIPGIALLVGCAVISRFVGPVIPVLNVLLIAILLGFAVANIVGVPEWAERGVRAHKIFLGAAIVLMGGSLTIGTVLESGLIVVLAVVCISTVTLVSVELCSRNIFGIDDKLSSLLAAGSSICGISAIVAVAGSIRASDEHVVYAAATILLFDALTLVIYPTVGQLLSIPGKVFGVWAGVSMFSTGPVIAVGFAHSDLAGQWATITKLTRNAFIGVVAVGYATYYARRRLGEDDVSDDSVRLRELWDRFPKFVAGFVVLMVFASVGALSAGQMRSLENAYNWLFLVAFVGLGTEIQIEKLRCAGAGPVLVVLVTLCVVSVLSLVVLSIAFA